MLVADAESRLADRPQYELLYLDIPLCTHGAADDKWLSKVADELRRIGPRIILISATTASLPNALRIAHEARAACPETFTVFGGPHEDAMPGETVARCADIDVSVAGEGEYAVPFLAQALLNVGCRSAFDADAFIKAHGSGLTKIPGLGTVFAASGEVRRERRPKTMADFGEKSLDLDSLPFIPRHVLPSRHRYHYPVFLDGNRIRPATQVMTRRGCLATCPFCSETAHMQERSIPSVLQELRMIRSQGYEAVFFDDSTFTDLSSARRAYVEEIGKQLRHLDFEWGCQTRVDMLDRSLLRSLRKYGCTYIYLGIESLDQQILRALGKKYTPTQSEAILKACANLGIRVGVSLLFGAPDEKHTSSETNETAERTMQGIRRFVESGTVEIVSLNLFAYYPGTPAYYAYKRQSLSPDLDFYHPPTVDDSYPFSLLEENPSYCPIGLRDIAPSILKRADELLGPAIAGQDKYSRNLIKYQQAKSIEKHHRTLQGPKHV
jgi:radical SAM superfamily enzyme YgiQ (UPF0313 family)